jgi:F5/8 type C domain
MTITKDHYKMRGISLYVMSMLLLSVVLFNLNNASISVAYGDKGNNNKVINRSLINDISDQVVTSNLSANKGQVQLVLQQIQTQIALTSGQDKATKAINQINSIIDLNPNGPLAQSLLFLAKRQAAGNTDVVIKAATQIAGKISNGGDDLGQPLAAQIAGTSSPPFSSPSLSSLSPQVSSYAGPLTSRQQQQSIRHTDNNNNNNVLLPTEGDTGTSILSNSPPQSVTAGIGEEPDTDQNEANALNGGEATTQANNLVVPDDTPFKSDKCDGSLDKFVPNPFIQKTNSPRFITRDCITVVGKVIWTHYINVDGDANFNVKLDSKYQSLLTPANNSPKFKGGIHVEVVCQGPNTSIDPIKVNQCKDPKYDGPRFKLPPVGTRVQVTGRYLIDVNEGGHSEIHPAYEVIFNPTSPPPPSPGTCQKLPISNVAAIGDDGINHPANAIDNNPNTRWSNLGVGSWIQADLGEKMTICSVDIAWYNGNQRQNNFVISVSNDGSTFTNVPFAGKSTGATERYNLPANTVGRFVRITVNGNTQNNWASITEIAVNAFA